MKFKTERPLPVLVFALVVGLISLTSAQASIPKAGATCTKLNTTAISGGFRFTCIANGKRNIWSRSVKLVATKQIPIPTHVPPFKSSDYPVIGTIARNIILSQKGNVYEPFSVIWDPSTSALKRRLYTAQLDVMRKYYSPMVPKGSKITVFILGSDKDWDTKQVTDYFSAYPDFDSSNKEKTFDVSSTCAAPDGYLLPDPSTSNSYSTYRGWGVGIEPKIAAAMVAYSNCDVNPELDILYHEVFHAVQWTNSYVTATFVKSQKKTKGKQSWGTGSVATWLMEGQAEYFGLLLKDDFQWNSFSLDSGGIFKANISQQWRTTDLSVLNTYSSTDSYFVGGLMYEYLLAKYGLEKTLSIHDETVKNAGLVMSFTLPEASQYAPFEKAFQSTFGQSVSSFYEEVKPYIEWAAPPAKIGGDYSSAAPIP